MTQRTLYATAVAPLACVLLASAGAASAQDNANSWTGFYVGANLGGTTSDGSAHAVVAPGPGPVALSPSNAAAINTALSNGGPSHSGGFTGGLEGGYNYQMGSWLLGVETDFDAFRLQASGARTIQSPLLTNPAIAYTVGATIKTNWLWTLRPRVGYVFGPWVVYGTAGLAMSNINASASYSDTRIAPTVFTSATRTDTQTGWTAGLGTAYALTPKWSLKGEWLYVRLGHVSETATTRDGFASISGDATAAGNLFRVGVDYKF